jgi:hypothetical protein
VTKTLIANLQKYAREPAWVEVKTRWLNKCRREAISDGIFAVAITLLILEVNTGSLFPNCAGANFPTLYRLRCSTGKRRGGASFRGRPGPRLISG